MGRNINTHSNASGDAKERLKTVLELAEPAIDGLAETGDALSQHLVDADRYLAGLGIRCQANRRVLVGILALALDCEPVIPEFEPGTKPLYRDRKMDTAHPERSKYGIVEWLRAIWGEEMATGVLTRAKLRELDPSAYVAVENWLRNASFPDDIKLPKQREVNDALAAALPPEALRAAGRVQDVMRRRRWVEKRNSL